MTIQRHVMLMALSVVGFVVLTLLFINAHGAERGAYQAAKDTVRELRELDTRLDSQTLQVRYSLSGNFDALVRTVGHLSARFRDLKRRSAEHAAPGDGEVIAKLTAAENAFTAKRDLVEEIKTQAAVFRNSSRYLPSALAECDVAEFSGELRRLLLSSLLAPSREAHDAVAALVARAEKDGAAGSASLRRAAAHARVLADRSAQLDGLVAEYLGVECRRAIDAASMAIDASRQRVEDRAGVYRLSLYSICGVLIFYVAAVLLHLARLNRSVRRFVPYKFLDLLGKSSVADIHVGDCMQQEMSVLFADIRSFTTISEKLTPRGVFQFINSYMAKMEPAIQGHGGVVSQYYGDGIMAMFPGTADEAVDAGVAMLRALVVFNAARQEAGDASIRIGIGINTGPLMLGTIGGPERLECNVISDVVNFASRIEGMNKMYGTALLISDRTYGLMKARERHTFRIVDHVRVQGMDRPCTVYEVMDGQDERALPEYDEGIALYHARDFAGAAAKFRACHDKLPGEQLFEVWLERCQGFEDQPPPGDWDGVVRLEKK